MFISPPTRRAMTKTGTYTGNAVDNRNINIGVDLASKTNAYVIIKGDQNQDGVHRTEYGQGDESMFFGNSQHTNNLIQAFTATGFQLGDNISNFDAVDYCYIAFWQEG